MSLIQKLGIDNNVIEARLRAKEAFIEQIENNGLMAHRDRIEACLGDWAHVLQCVYLLGKFDRFHSIYSKIYSALRVVYGPHQRNLGRNKNLPNVTWSLEVDELACWSSVMKDSKSQGILANFDIDNNAPSEGTGESQRISSRMLLSALRMDRESIANDMFKLTSVRSPKASRDRLYGSMIKGVVCDGNRDAIRSFLVAWKKKYFNPIAPYHRFSYHATVLCHLYGITIDDPDLSLHIIDVPEAVKARARAAVATLDVKV